MSSGAGLNPTLDERMLITKLQQSNFLEALQSKPSLFKGFQTLKRWYIEKSIESKKYVRSNNQMLPAGASGEAQIVGDYGSFDWSISTIKHMIKYDYTEKELSDLRLSGAYAEILKNITENNIMWFYEIVGKLWQGVLDGVVNYVDTNGNIIKTEEIRTLEGEQICVPVARVTSSLYYQRVNGVMTDVARNNTNLPLTFTNVVANHIRLTSEHRKPSYNEEATPTINPSKFYLLVHPTEELNARSEMTTNANFNSDSEINVNLPTYEIATVLFPNPKMWVQLTDLAKVGLVHYIGKTTFPRSVMPTLRLGKVDTETGALEYYVEAEVGLACGGAEGFIINTAP